MTDDFNDALERMEARHRDVRSKLRAWMDEQNTPWKIKCHVCLEGDRYLNFDASINDTIKEGQFVVRYFRCKCWKKAPQKPSTKVLVGKKDQSSVRPPAPDP